MALILQSNLIPFVTIRAIHVMDFCHAADEENFSGDIDIIYFRCWYLAGLQSDALDER